MEKPVGSAGLVVFNFHSLSSLALEWTLALCSDTALTASFYSLFILCGEVVFLLL